ncbi:MAG TPA: phage holin family protein [bacterium]
MRFLLRAAIAAFGLWLAAQVVPGIRFDGAGALAGAALVLGIANAVVRPVLVVLTLPITILTLGLFLFVVNAATFALVALVVPGFHLEGFAPALLGSLLVSFVGWVGTAIIHPR